jgi:hypothetical protein
MAHFIIEYRFKNGVTESFLLGEQALDRMDFAWLFDSSLFEIDRVVIRRASVGEIRDHGCGTQPTRLAASNAD